MNTIYESDAKTTHPDRPLRRSSLKTMESSTRLKIGYWAVVVGLLLSTWALPTKLLAASIVAGGSTSFCVDNDNVAWAAGDNRQGQFGDGTQTNRAAPVPVMSGVQAIAADKLLAAKFRRAVSGFETPNRADLHDGLQKGSRPGHTARC